MPTSLKTRQIICKLWSSPVPTCEGSSPIQLQRKGSMRCQEQWLTWVCLKIEPSNDLPCLPMRGLGASRGTGLAPQIRPQAHAVPDRLRLCTGGIEGLRIELHAKRLAQRMGRLFLSFPQKGRFGMGSLEVQSHCPLQEFNSPNHSCSAKEKER